MIIVITRSLNEAHRVNEFCLAYKDADKILIADGGSTDETVKLAKRFHNVEVLDFHYRVQLENGHWRNPDSMHVNFLIKHAYSYNPDWIILDDIDCRPNIYLKNSYREILNEAKYSNKNYIMAVRLYLWGLEQHFPLLAQPGTPGVWEASMWAWRGNLDFWTVDDNFPHYSLREGERKIPYEGFDQEKVDLLPPNCLLHYTWDSEERVNKKLDHHRNGLGIYMNHPLDMGGPLEELPLWATE